MAETNQNLAGQVSMNETPDPVCISRGGWALGARQSRVVLAAGNWVTEDQG